MDNQLQPIASMETLEVNARERFSERLTVTSVGILALNLFALSCVWQYSLKLALSETVDWVCLVFAFLTTVFVVMTGWKDFKNAYMYCQARVRDEEAARAVLELSFADAEQYDKFRSCARAIDAATVQLLTDAVMQQDDSQRLSIDVAMAKLRFRDKEKGLILDVWGMIK